MKKILALSAISCVLFANVNIAIAQFDTLINFNGTTTGNLARGSLVITGNTLFGMTEFGGASNNGNVFSIKTNGSRYKSLFAFNITNGQYPMSTLTYGGGHTVYGVTYNGGVNGFGCVFSMDTNGSNYKDLWDFSNPPSTNGSAPVGALIIIGHKLYGMTTNGGIHSSGNVFSIDTGGGGYKDIYDLNAASGYSPNGALTLLGNYELCGMTQSGGVNGVGTIFSVDTDGTNFKKRWDFGGVPTNGAYPLGSLIIVGHQFYGMTTNGGTSGKGNIFSIDTGGTNYKDRLDFTGANGTHPNGDLLLKGKTLYGMTSAGGANSDGVIFSIDTNGTMYTDVWDFNNYGANPYGNLIYSGGVLYGMTSAQGNAGVGVVFKYALMSLKITDTNISCNGSNTGHATVYVTGGTAPFTYSWTGGSTLDKATGLSAGTYSVTVTGNDGMSVTANVTITQPALITAAHDSTADNGSHNGSAGLVVSGGTAPYTYLWTPGGGTTATISSLSAGTYTCTVQDNNGCTYSTSVVVKSTASGISSISNTAGQITVYPNPNNGVFRILFSHPELVSVSQTIRVYNVLGEQVYSSFTIYNSPFTIDMSSRPNGIYLYRVLSENGNLVGEGKLIIQK